MIAPAELVSAGGYYKLHPKQYEAARMLGLLPYDPPTDLDPVDEMLFGGAAGGGKSALLRIIAVTYALQYPGSRIGLFRRKFKELIQNHVHPLLKEMSPPGSKTDAPGEMNWTRMEYRFHNGSIIEFHHCEQDNDYLDYHGFEWDIVLFDESTKFPTVAILFISSRCRSTRPGWHRTIVYASNPLGPSHRYFKLEFYEPGQDRESFLYQDELTGEVFRRAFLRSVIEDNLSWENPKAIRAGIQKISAEDPVLARAQLDGDWDTESGNFFADFRRNLHVVPPFEIPSHWPCWRGLDWGNKAPAACVWLAKDPDSPYPRVYAYREWVKAEVPTQIQAHQILKLSAKDPPIRATYLDPACWNRTNGMDGPSHAKEYQRGGLTDLVKGYNRRPEGWARINRALYHAPDREIPPELMIFSTCPNLIRFLANAQRDEQHDDDVMRMKGYTGDRDDCLIGPTNVLTPDGEVQLHNLRAGDTIWTRGGWRPVARVWKKAEKKTCLRVQMSNGRSLYATPDHKIWVEEKGWLTADALSYGDILSAWQMQKSSSSTASNFDAIQIHFASTYGDTIGQVRAIVKKGLGRFIRRSGRRSMGQSRTDPTSTTPMVINSIMMSGTLNVSPAQRTRSITFPFVMQSIGSEIASTLRRFARFPWNGTEARPAWSGIGSTASLPGSVWSSILLKGFAINAGQSSRPHSGDKIFVSARTPVSQPGAGLLDSIMSSESVPFAEQRSPSIAMQNPKPARVHVVGVSEAGTWDVYDLTVLDAEYHEFLAEGVIISNCGDALRYGLAASSGMRNRDRQTVRTYGFRPS